MWIFIWIKSTEWNISMHQKLYLQIAGPKNIQHDIDKYVIHTYFNVKWLPWSFVRVVLWLAFDLRLTMTLLVEWGVIIGLVPYLEREAGWNLQTLPFSPSWDTTLITAAVCAWCTVSTKSLLNHFFFLPLNHSWLTLRFQLRQCSGDVGDSGKNYNHGANSGVVWNQHCVSAVRRKRIVFEYLFSILVY